MNFEPPEFDEDAMEFELPSGRWVNNWPDPVGAILLVGNMLPIGSLDFQIDGIVDYGHSHPIQVNFERFEDED